MKTQTTQTQHTPAPWKVDETWGLIKHGTTEICALHSGNAANSRLIAAAPELLEALRECITDPDAHCMNEGTRAGLFRRMEAINAIARAAIAKAEGKE